MKTAEICRNCKYGDLNKLKKWCSYHNCEIGAIVATYGCSRFEKND